MPPTNCLQQAASALVVLLLAVGASAATPHSKLWGEGGELFKLTEKGRLQDWSWAGEHIEAASMEAGQLT
jgi:hypothetical protein